MRNLLRGKGFCRFLLISVLFIFVASWAEGATTWITETVDSEGDVGKYTSIAVDSRGDVHISYYDATNGALKYATNSSGSWVTETVESSGYSSWYLSRQNSIAVDSRGNVHISYKGYHPLYGVLKYATNASGSWVTETIDDSSGGVIYGGSIALDSSGNVHISYHDNHSLPHDLKYATNASGSWITETVDSISEYSNLWYSSIALDSRDNVHISYGGYRFYSYTGTLKYATNASGSWATKTVDRSGGERRLHTSIALDSSDNVHISYITHYWYDYDYTDEDIISLKYTTNASGSWVIETIIETIDSIGEYASIAIDSRDNVHISYTGSIAGSIPDVRHATNASGSWVTEAVASGRYTSIAVDSRGNVHISYYDATNGDLKYATNSHKRRGRR